MTYPPVKEAGGAPKGTHGGGHAQIGQLADWQALHAQGSLAAAQWQWIHAAEALRQATAVAHGTRTARDLTGSGTREPSPNQTSNISRGKGTIGGAAGPPGNWGEAQLQPAELGGGQQELHQREQWGGLHPAHEPTDARGPPGKWPQRTWREGKSQAEGGGDRWTSSGARAAADTPDSDREWGGQPSGHTCPYVPAGATRASEGDGGRRVQGA